MHEPISTCLSVLDNKSCLQVVRERSSTGALTDDKSTDKPRELLMEIKFAEPGRQSRKCCYAE